MLWVEGEEVPSVPCECLGAVRHATRAHQLSNHGIPESTLLVDVLRRVLAAEDLALRKGCDCLQPHTTQLVMHTRQAELVAMRGLASAVA